LENRLVIDGALVKAPEVRRSPAGIPIGRFMLEHRSVQSEAGMQREAICRVAVVAAGEGFEPQLRSLQPGTMIKVSGFLSRADYRQADYRLVMHAERLELL
jgi:primosomal replication protein N